MNLIMINDRILNLDHVVEIHFTDKLITIEKAVSRLVYGLGDVNTGNNLSAESFEELKQILETKCQFIIYGQKEEKKKMPKDYIDPEYIDTLYQSKSGNFQKPPASVLNRAGASDDDVEKFVDKVIKKSRKKKEKKDA